MSREILSYTISNAVSGHCLGIFDGTSKDDALDALARDAGYADYAEACEAAPDDGELIVTEIESA